MILVDSNIPMYLVGADHPNKLRSQARLGEAVDRGDRLVTDVEVFQEILHRSGAIDRPDAIQPAFDVLLGIVDEVIDVTLKHAQGAKRMMLESPGLSARDALHLAVMETEGVDRIMSFDAGFDGHPGVERLA